MTENKERVVFVFAGLVLAAVVVGMTISCLG